MTFIKIMSLGSFIGEEIRSLIEIKLDI